MKQLFTLTLRAFSTMSCFAQVITGTIPEAETIKYTVQAYGSPAVGGLYYVAVRYSGL